MNVSRTRRLGVALVFSSLSWLAAVPAIQAAPEVQPLPSAQAAQDAAADEKPAVRTKPHAKTNTQPKGDVAASAAAPDDAGPVGEKPRHGSRQKTPDGTVVIYDKITGAWRVPSLGEGYWTGERFYRYESGLWLTAKGAGGPWELVSVRTLSDSAKRHPTPKEAVTARLPSGLEVVFEPRLKVFKVAGHKGVFLFDASFYRVDSGLWLGSSSVDGPWAPTSSKLLPVPLRRAVGDPDEGQTVTLPSGEVVVWEASSKVFTLKDKPTVVLHDGTYFEKRDDEWFESAQSSAGFTQKNVQDIPLAVRFKFRKQPGARAGAGGKNAKAEKKGADAGKAGKAGQSGKAGQAGQNERNTAAERRAGKAGGAHAAGNKAADSAADSGNESE